MQTTELPDPDSLTRQPGTASAGGAEDRTEITPEQAVEEAKAQREAAERERDAALAREQTIARERDDATKRAADAGAQVFTAQEQAIESGLATQKTIVDQAKSAIAAAQAAGDSLAVADAFDRLAEARATMRDLENRKLYFAAEKQRQPKPEDQQTAGVRVQTPGGTMVISASAKQWMDQHSRFYNDAPYYNHAVAAHSTIVADGIQEGSPAYFRALTETMGRFEKFEQFERGEHNGERQPVNGNQQPRRPASSMGAPVSRSTQPASNNGIPDPLTIARRIGPAVTVDDLREGARINGYRGDKGFEQYLKDLEEIHQIERSGGDTGMRVDGVYR